jgi:hypothetical protein
MINHPNRSKQRTAERPRVELRSVEYSERMSEETSYFIAQLYIDGKKHGVVQNDGHGGCHRYETRDAEIALAEIARAADPEIEERLVCLEADSLVDEALERFLKERDMARYRRRMQKEILFKKADGNLYTIKPKNPANLAVMLQRASEHPSLKDATVIINLLPEAEQRVHLFAA